MATRCIGVLSDTHGLLREPVKDRLRGCERIIHAGDVDDPGVLANLREIAPVVAVRGNMDRASWAQKLDEVEYLDVDGRGIYVIHDRSRLNAHALPVGTNVVVCGHSHRPHVEYVDGVLYLNPGSAGPRRFSLPVSMALLHIRPDGIRPELIEIPA
ncbi:MAG: metallophosphoesterase family protein [Sedimentisphaerales bacterium]|nr:metallophosphoesterase family protein [Sedimentisphaerales bacterium]